MQALILLKFLPRKGYEETKLPADTSKPAYFNGQFVENSAISIPPDDQGFVLGTTVAERLRTFNGKLFRVPEHLARLKRSLQITGVTLPLTDDELASIADEVTRRSYQQLPPGADTGLTLLVTPGSGGQSEPLVAIYCSRLPFAEMHQLYTAGQSLRVSQIRQVPAACWPPELKCRSRMHYWLADRQTRDVEPSSRALLLDLDGHVTEASTANILIYNQSEGIVSPPQETILPGVSAGCIADLARQAGITYSHRPLKPEDVAAADEVFLCSTSPCIFPVTSFEGKPVGDGKPGAMFQQILAAWSTQTGCDIAGQAARFGAAN